MKVTVIMPTTPSREPMMQRAIDNFTRQDYPDKELLIIDDGVGRTKYMRPGSNVWHWGMDGATIGAKRNEGAGNARGEIILHMDSDDFYAPDWISKSVNHLINSGTQLTGLREAYFLQPGQRMWRYEYPKDAQPYVVGATLCYYRALWEHNPFPDVSEGEDTIFCANAGRISPHGYMSGFVAMIHGGNTASHKQLGKKEFKPIHPSFALALLGKDYEKY